MSTMEVSNFGQDFLLVGSFSGHEILLKSSGGRLDIFFPAYSWSAVLLFCIDSSFFHSDSMQPNPV